MPKEAEFCILGAGLAGLSLADALREADLSTVVIDKEEAGSGASGTPGGLVNPATGRRAKKAWRAEACYEAISANLEKVSRHTGRTFYKNNGLLRPALLEKMARKMKDQYQKTSWPEGWCQWKEEKEIQEMHPGIQCVDGGLWLPIGLTVDIGEYAKAYASYLEDQQVPVMEGRKVEIKKDTSRWIVTCGNTSVNCEHLVYATGHSTGKSPYWEWLPLNLIKGQVGCFEKREGDLSFSHSISSLGYIANTGSKNSFIQGSTYEHDFHDLKPDLEGEQYLRKRMRRTLPRLEKEVHIKKRWAGVRTSTPDYKPILGPHPEDETLHVFTGLGSKGLLYSKYLAGHYVDYLVNNVSLYPEISVGRLEATHA